MPAVCWTFPARREVAQDLIKFYALQGKSDPQVTKIFLLLSCNAPCHPLFVCLQTPSPLPRHSCDQAEGRRTAEGWFREAKFGAAEQSGNPGFRRLMELENFPRRHGERGERHGKARKYHTVSRFLTNFVK
jgi:hypothetical protein